VRGKRVLSALRYGRAGDLEAPEEVRATPYAATFHFAAGQLAVWTSFPVRIEGDTAVADVTMGSCDEIWPVMGWDSRPDDWTHERAAEAFEAVLGYWREWSANLKVDAIEPGAARLRRSAITVHLLSRIRGYFRLEPVG
jgi:hypothetical protein